MKKTYFKFFPLVIALIFFGLSLKAQTIVRGEITDEESGEAMIAVQIYADGTPAYAETDENGKYVLQIPYTKDQTYQLIRFQYLGYAEYSDFIRVTPDGKLFEVEQDVALKSQAVKLEDVFVTANKVEEEMQDVPIAISVVDAREIQQKTASNVAEAFFAIPNLLTESYVPGSFAFSLRGLSSDFSNPGIENSVGLYIDDIYFSRAYHFNSTLMDIERVEVLRGPQGTLFGKNTIGGVLHVITESPKMGNSGAIEVSGGNYSLLQVRGKGNLMLAKDKLAIRFTAAYRKRDGWLLIENNETSKDANKTEFYGGRLSLLYKPSDKLNITIKGTKSEDLKAEDPLDYMPRIFGPSFPTVDDNPLNRKSSPNFEDPKYTRSLIGGSAKFEYKLDDKHTLTFLSSYHHAFTEEDQDFDHSELDFTDFFRDINYKTRSHELRISTPRKGQRLFYLAGLYYLDEKIESKDVFTFGQSWFQVFKQVAMLPAALQVPDYYADATGVGVNEGKSFAGFGTVSYEISERVRVNAGLRYTNEKRNLAYYQTLNGYEPFNFINFVLKEIGTAATPELRESNQNFISGNIGMDFKTSDNTLIYASVARGFKGAGFNVTLNPAERGGDLVFKPESINSYEVGLKIKVDDRMRINTAAFATVYKDKQEYVVAGQSSRVINAESAEGVGLESEWSAQWSDYFRTDMAVGAQNLTYFDFPFFDLVGQPVNLSGNNLFKSPNFTFRFTPQWKIDAGTRWDLLLRADYNYTSKSYNDIYNTEILARKPSSILNARIGFANKDNKYSIAIWGKNLLDETFFENVWTFTNWTRVALNPPRTFGVEFRVNFY